MRALQARFPGERIEILYAGCGFYTMLADPLATKFSDDEIRLTLLDVYARSLESARSVFAAFGLEERVGDYIQVDAAEYRCPQKPHLIVTEVMKRARKRTTICRDLQSRSSAAREWDFYSGEDYGRCLFVSTVDENLCSSCRRGGFNSARKTSGESELIWVG